MIQDADVRSHSGARGYSSGLAVRLLKQHLDMGALSDEARQQATEERRRQRELEHYSSSADMKRRNPLTGYPRETSPTNLNSSTQRSNESAGCSAGAYPSHPRSNTDSRSPTGVDASRGSTSSRIQRSNPSVGRQQSATEGSDEETSFRRRVSESGNAGEKVAQVAAQLGRGSVDVEGRRRSEPFAAHPAAASASLRAADELAFVRSREGTGIFHAASSNAPPPPGLSAAAGSSCTDVTRRTSAPQSMVTASRAVLEPQKAEPKIAASAASSHRSQRGKLPKRNSRRNSAKADEHVAAQDTPQYGGSGSSPQQPQSPPAWGPKRGKAATREQQETREGEQPPGTLVPSGRGSTRGVAESHGKYAWKHLRGDDAHVEEARGSDARGGNARQNSGFEHQQAVVGEHQQSHSRMVPRGAEQSRSAYQARELSSGVEDLRPSDASRVSTATATPPPMRWADRVKATPSNVGPTRLALSALRAVQQQTKGATRPTPIAQAALHTVQQQEQRQQQKSTYRPAPPPTPTHTHSDLSELKAGLRKAGDAPGLQRRAAFSLDNVQEATAVVKREGSAKGPGQGRHVNITQGLKLGRSFLSREEQARVVGWIREQYDQGMRGNLRGRTFLAPKKTIKGKGRVTIQYGCVYNYREWQGKPKGIQVEEDVEGMPDMLQAIADRLVEWRVVKPDEKPDSAIINLYSKDDCIPPHIDHHDFLRPFVTISLLSEQSITFGLDLVPVTNGVFRSSSRLPNGEKADVSIALPTGSVLVLAGNGADVAQHCVSSVSAERYSITMRRMQAQFSEAIAEMHL